MSKFKAALGQLRCQCRIGGGQQKQHEGGGHHIMFEAGGRDLFGADATADHVIALEHQNLLALQSKKAGRNKRINAAPDDHIVSHYFPTRARTRNGLPVPFLILSGAAMITAPLGGSLSRLHRLARP